MTTFEWTVVGVFIMAAFYIYNRQGINRRIRMFMREFKKAMTTYGELDKAYNEFDKEVKKAMKNNSGPGDSPTADELPAAAPDPIKLKTRAQLVQELCDQDKVTFDGNDIIFELSGTGGLPIKFTKDGVPIISGDSNKSYTSYVIFFDKPVSMHKLARNLYPSPNHKVFILAPTRVIGLKERPANDSHSNDKI